MANNDITDIITPVSVSHLHEALIESKYDAAKVNYLIEGFTNGFSLEYNGHWERQDTAKNIPIDANLASEEDLWIKMMKEVKLKHFAGPFLPGQFPFKNFVQSPVGLVPKHGGQTRLIFHLSYDFKKSGNKSINAYIPKHKCSVKYKDLDHAVRGCLKLLEACANMDSQLWFGISDIKSAFRLVPLARQFWKLLTMKVRDPETQQWYWFVDKCLPFGAAISYAIFQLFSNALSHLLQFRLQKIKLKSISNYLDDFLNVALSETDCNGMLRVFHELLEWLGVPLAKEKTVWATLRIIFLGILLDGEKCILALPIDNINKAVYLVKIFISRKRSTVKDLQKLSGLLNFLHRAIYPGRAFTRHMYAKFASLTLKPHHHINLDAEFRSDCLMWLTFLESNTPSVYCRPFTDFDKSVKATELDFYTDSSAAPRLGFGGMFRKQSYFVGQWELGYILKFKPSIEYLELYAVCIGVYIWSDHIRDLTVVLHCDNISVVSMINNTTSGCKHCMHLIGLIVVRGLCYNFRIKALHVKTADNGLADSLSRLQFKRFRRLAGDDMATKAESLPTELWPAS